MLWWRRKHGDIEKGTSTMDTWDEFKQQLKKQFCPHNVEDVAMKKLRGLKHERSIKDYVGEFTSLMFDLPELSEKQKLFYFLDGLQSWAHMELKRRNVQSVDEAIVVAEDLIELKRDFGPKRFGGGDKPHKVGKPEAKKVEYKKFDKPSFKGKEKANEGSSKSEIKCFMCNGPQ